MRAAAVRGLAAALGLVAALASAQSYPTRTVRIIVPTAAGGGIDVSARIVAPKLAELWGQAVVVENRPGAAMALGVDAVAKAAPDGYTLLVAHEGAICMNPVIYPKLPHNPQRDLAPVSLMATAPLLVVVHAGFPASSFQELLAYARAHPGKLNHANGGSATRMALELLNALGRVQITDVAYKGLAPALASVMAGETQLSLPDAGSATAAIRSGKVRALAVTTARSVPQFPGLPTVADSGVPGYDMSTWRALFATAGTPADVVSKIETDLRAVLAMADVRDKYAALSMEVAAGSSEELRQRVRVETDKWARLVKEAGIKFEQ